MLDDAIIGELYLVDNDEPQPWENDLDLAKWAEVKREVTILHRVVKEHDRESQQAS